MKQSRYIRGDRLIHIQKKVPFRYLDAEKHNGKVYYLGIDDNGNRIFEEPQMVRLLQKDSNGNYYTFDGEKRYLSHGKVWYHGTDAVITKFKFNGRKDANDEDGVGIYFTNDVEVAKGYGKFVYVVTIPEDAVELKRTDPANLTEARKLILQAPRLEIGLSNYGQDQESALQSFFESNDTTNKKELMDSVWYDFYRYDEEAFVDNLAKLGYDYSKTKKTDKVTNMLVYNANKITIVKTIQVKK